MMWNAEKERSALEGENKQEESRNLVRTSKTKCYKRQPEAFKVSNTRFLETLHVH